MAADGTMRRIIGFSFLIRREKTALRSEPGLAGCGHKLFALFLQSAKARKLLGSHVKLAASPECRRLLTEESTVTYDILRCAHLNKMIPHTF